MGDLFSNLSLGVGVALTPINLGIMLAGIYYGAQYGSSTTAILATSRASPPPSSPRSMATRWPAKGVPAWRSASQPSVRSLPAR
jgi:hypothetical protein